MDAVFEQATSIIYQHQRTVFSRVAIYPTELLEPEIANGEKPPYPHTSAVCKASQYQTVSVNRPNRPAKGVVPGGQHELPVETRLSGGPARTRTWNQTVMSRQL